TGAMRTFLQRSPFLAAYCYGNIPTIVMEGMASIAIRPIRRSISMLLSRNLYCPRRWLQRQPLQRHPLPRQPKAPDLLSFFLMAVLALPIAGTKARADQACIMLNAQQAETRVHVELSASEPEKAYCIRARKRQNWRAGISNAQGVEPSGRVISPGGKMDGGPGGPFYRGEL